MPWSSPLAASGSAHTHTQWTVPLRRGSAQANLSLTSPPTHTGTLAPPLRLAAAPLLLSSALFLPRPGVVLSRRALSTAPALKTGFRASPLRHLLTFAFLHPALAWAVFPPVYALCHYTNLATLVLAGPSGTALLRTRIPAFIPDGLVYGLRDTRARHGRGEDTPATAGDDARDPTIEEWAEMAVRKSAGVTWRSAKALGGFIKRVRAGRGEGGEGQDEPLGLEDLQNLAADVSRQGVDLEDHQAAKKVPANNESSASWWRSYMQDEADEVRFSHVADGVAAWLVIKCLFPLRLPISLWLTPRVVSRFL